MHDASENDVLSSGAYKTLQHIFGSRMSYRFVPLTIYPSVTLATNTLNTELPKQVNAEFSSVTQTIPFYVQSYLGTCTILHFVKIKHINFNCRQDKEISTQNCRSCTANTHSLYNGKY